MSSPTVPEPPVESQEAVVEYAPPRQSAARSRRRRRRGVSTIGQTLLTIALRVFVVLATAFAFLVLWQETAYAQTENPAPEPSSGRPSGIDEWVRQIKEQDQKKGEQKPSTSKPSPQTPKPQTPTSKPTPADRKEIVPSPNAQRTPEPGTEPKRSVTRASSPQSRPASGGSPPIRSQAGSGASPATSANAQDAELQGSTVQLAAPQSLGDIPDRELLWHSSLDLILALEREFAFVDPPLVAETLERDLNDQLLTLSGIIGPSDNPRENLEQLRRFLVDTLGYAAFERETPDIDLLLPRFLMTQKRGSPLCLAMISLALADTLNEYLELEPVTVAGLLGLRYRSGYHRYILVPSYLDRLYDDESFVRAAHGGAAPADAKIRILTRKEFWAMVVGAAGASLATQDRNAKAEQLLRRSLGLNPKQALPRVALADLLRKKRELQAAREELDLAVAHAPDHVMARLARADVLKELGLEREMENDLEWLFRRRGHEQAGIRLIRTYLERGLFAEAAREWDRLSAMPPKTLSQAQQEAMALEVGAAPWIARLRNSSDDRDRFTAMEQLTRYPTAATIDALIETLSDSNLRLANFACNTLKKLTGMNLPRNPQRWREAVSRRRQ